MADLLVLPTKNDAYSNVICEGFSQALPCIASAVGGIPELVMQSQAGFLLPPDSPIDLWAERILAFASNHVEQHAMKERALAYANEQLKMDKFQKIVRAVLQKFQNK